MAPKYRKIDPRMWDDEQFDELPAGEALVATWLLTSKEVLRCGVAVFTLGTAADKGRLQGVKEAWDTLSTVCTKMDWPVQKTSRSTVVVIFPRWFKHNPPTNLDHFKGMMSDMSDVPRCDVIKSHYHRTKCDLMDKYHDTFDTLSRGCTTGCTPKPSTPEAEAEAEAEAVTGAGGNGRAPSKTKRPTLEEVTEYCVERDSSVDPQYFLDWQEANGWKLSNGNPLKSWQAAIRNWEHRDAKVVRLPQYNEFGDLMG